MVQRKKKLTRLLYNRNRQNNMAKLHLSYFSTLTLLMGIALLMIILCYAPVYGVGMPSAIRKILVYGCLGVGIFLLLSEIGYYFSQARGGIVDSMVQQEKVPQGICNIHDNTGSHLHRVCLVYKSYQSATPHFHHMDRNSIPRVLPRKYLLERNNKRNCWTVQAPYSI